MPNRGRTVRVEVLGTFRGEAAGVSVLPTASKPRQILALLALNAQHIVPVPVLMEELWGAGPPRSAPTTLQTYVLQLRRRLRAAVPGATGVWDKNVLVTRHGGYLLNAEPSDIDALEFDRLTRAGHTAYEAGDMAAASGSLTAALELWRGPVLADVPHGRHLGIEVTRLRRAGSGHWSGASAPTCGWGGTGKSSVNCARCANATLCTRACGHCRCSPTARTAAPAMR